MGRRPLTLKQKLRKGRLKVLEPAIKDAGRDIKTLRENARRAVGFPGQDREIRRLRKRTSFLKFLLKEKKKA